MTDFRGAEQVELVAAAAQRLRVDAATAEVVRAFAASGVESVLLKGPALAAWYPDQRTRFYLDCDLWVNPAHTEEAASAMVRIGFSPDPHEQGLPSWWLAHATAWSRDTDDVVVDLHRNLQGMAVEPAVAWGVLTAASDTVEVAGYPVRVLSVPGRALYVTLHAAHHGDSWGKAISHVERALIALDDMTWRESAELARQVDAVDALSAGLRLTPEGAALAERLGLGPPRSIEVSLRAGNPPPGALGIDRLAKADGTRARVRIIVRKFFPPPGFIRAWWPPAARNRRMLVLGYVRRPIWLLRSAPAGLRAWLEARRRVRRN